MNRTVPIVVSVMSAATVSAVDSARAAEVGTAFTYQGYLEKPAGTPVTNTCDFEFSLWDDGDPALPETQIGPTLTFDGQGGNPASVQVAGGVFSVALDFGEGAINGTARWLQIKVCCPSTCAPVLLSPRVELTPAPHALALPGLYTQQNIGGSPNVIGGYAGNTVGPGVVAATIGGGGVAVSPNRVTDLYGTVSGGVGNQAGDNAGPPDRLYPTVGGGSGNTASHRASTVSGGISNTASGDVSTVGGGYSNTASATYATVGGGYSNTASAGIATVGGGASNTASGSYATVGGGRSNAASAAYATIAGGGESTPGTSATANRVTDAYGTVGGGGNNQAGDNAGTAQDRSYATVGGGNQNTASGAYSTVGGGASNTASHNFATVGGGSENTASGLWSTVGGGSLNIASGFHSTVGGGEFNAASGDSAAVGGGDQNRASGTWSTIGGGEFNYAFGKFATVGGGGGNMASGESATVPGGGANSADGDHSFAAGHGAKVRDAVAAGDDPVACSATTTCGDEGTFVWADSTIVGFTSTGPNQFLIRASGGVGIGTNAPDAPLNVDGGTDAALADASGYLVVGNKNAENIVLDDNEIIARANGAASGLFLNNGSGNVGILRGSASHPLHIGTNFLNGNGAHLTVAGAWTNGSSREWKENFEPVDKQEVLRKVVHLPVTQWRYKGEDPSNHIGPVAEDFRAAFGLGHDDHYITTIDADGVALAAVQGLHQIVQENEKALQEKDCEIGALENEISNLKSHVSNLKELEARLARLEALLQGHSTTKEKP